MIEFNEEQKEIINYLNGPCLVISCPGSGKTTTMIGRAQALIDSGVEPNKILIMTFTKAAADSMKKKYLKTYDKHTTDICFGTIHAVCFHILCNTKGYQLNNLMQEIDKWEILGKIIQGKVDFSEREETIKGLISEISYVKNKMLPVERYRPEVCDKKLFMQCFNKYEAEKRRLNKIDFDDMLLLTLELLTKDKEIASFYQLRWSYIMVDEFQDTNIVQDRIISLLVNKEKPNICVVGDDDQGIYGFRSANVDVILNFPKRYKDCHVFHLSKNYRSEPEIIDRAGKLIAHNRKRYKKDFLSHKTGKADIRCFKYETCLEQTKSVTSQIKQLIEKGNKDIAVLYRTNQENQMLINHFMTNNIDFYTTESVKNIHNSKVFCDVMSYFRLSQGIEREDDLSSILNRPTRYLKSEAFRNCPYDKNELIKRCAQLKNGDRAVLQVLQMIKDIQSLKGKKPAEFVDYLYNKMNYKESYIKYMDFLGKDETEAEMQLNVILDEANLFDTFEKWMDYVDEYGKKLKKKMRERKGVALSTFHSSKGLEWDNVFIINAVEGNMPHKKSSDTVAGTEEERRLFYVAFTRARQRVIISYVNGDKSKPSCFLKEMGMTGTKK